MIVMLLLLVGYGMFTAASPSTHIMLIMLSLNRL